MEGSHQLPTSKPLPVLPAVEAAKRLAAFAAVDRHVGLKHKVSRRGPGLASALASAWAFPVTVTSRPAYPPIIRSRYHSTDSPRSSGSGPGLPCHTSWTESSPRARRPTSAESSSQQVHTSHRIASHRTHTYTHTYAHIANTARRVPVQGADHQGRPSAGRRGPIPQARRDD
jgi:hypothetical protein